MKLENTTIIGAGPAGIAAAIQLDRYGFEPIIFEKERIGGLLVNANLVENYPGFPDGISGLSLAALFQRQLKNSSVRFFCEKVTSLDYENAMFLVTTQKRVFSSRTVVVASGTKPTTFIDFEIPELAKERVFYEVFSLANVMKKEVIIVGGGDAAFDYALNLEKRNQVIILHRGETVRCLPLLWERAIQSSNIKYHKDTRLTNLIADSPERLLIEYSGPEGIMRIDADYLIFALGREPQLDFLTEKLRQNARELERKGLLYFAGDVTNGIFRQTAISVGNGIMAAMKVEQKLRELAG